MPHNRLKQHHWPNINPKEPQIGELVLNDLEDSCNWLELNSWHSVESLITWHLKDVDLLEVHHFTWTEENKITKRLVD